MIVTLSRWRLLGAATAALASLYHLTIAVYLLTVPEFTKTTYGQDSVLDVPAFFFVLGAFQLIWAWETYKEKAPLMIGIGTAGFLGSITLYLTALATPLPFGILQQTLSLPGLLAKIIETAYVIVSISLIRELPTETVRA